MNLKRPPKFASFQFAIGLSSGNPSWNVIIHDLFDTRYRMYSTSDQKHVQHFTLATLQWMEGVSNPEG